METVRSSFVEEGRYHYEIGLWGFGFNVFDQEKEGVVGEGLSEYPYLLILTKLRTGDRKNQFERMNMKVYEENGKYAGMLNGRYRNVWRFSSNVFCKNIGFLVSAPDFGPGGVEAVGEGRCAKDKWK